MRSIQFVIRHQTRGMRDLEVRISHGKNPVPDGRLTARGSRRRKTGALGPVAHQVRKPVSNGSQATQAAGGFGVGM